MRLYRYGVLAFVLLAISICANRRNEFSWGQFEGLSIVQMLYTILIGVRLLIREYALVVVSSFLGIYFLFSFVGNVAWMITNRKPRKKLQV